MSRQYYVILTFLDFIAKDEEYVEFEEIHEMFRRGGI